MIYPFKEHTPKIDSTVYIAEYATITGDVTIGANSSVWFSAVIRGDVSPVVIGKNVSIQDLSCLHQSPNMPLIIEDNVIIGHQVTLHSCTIRKNALVGMGAIVLDGAEVGEGAFIGAGALVPPGMKIPPHSLALGSPAKVVRPVNDADRKEMTRIVGEYVKKGLYYKALQAEKKD